MAPVKPIEGRDWGGDRWLRKKISVYASGVTLKYPLSVRANWSAKMRATLGPEINIAFRVGQTNAM
jgi:hypothetical protein